MKNLFFALCCFVTPGILYSGEVLESHGSTPGVADVVVRTTAALKQEVAGNVEAAQAQLQQIIDEFPDAELARWRLGYVRDGQDWWMFSRFVEEAGRWPELYKYQQERIGRNDTFKDHLFLADGCRAHQLFDQERAHLYRVLRLDGNFQEARQRLGQQQFNGIWLTSEQVRREQARQSRDLALREEWRPRVERLARELERTSGAQALKMLRQRLNDIRTPDAIPAMESFFACRSETAAAMFLNWAARIPSYESSLALARQAVFSENPRLRVQAQSLLRERPQEDYVPWLLSGLETVKETAFDWEIDLNGLAGLRIHRTLVVNGEQMELTVDHQQQFINGRGLPLTVQYHPDGTVDARLTQVYRQRYQAFVGVQNSPVLPLLQVLERSRAISSWNSSNQERRTERILRALSEGTGESTLQTPEDWWTWWRKQTDYALLAKTKAKDQYSETWFVDERLPQPKPLRSLQTELVIIPSCFAAGTMVETEQGPRPIEKIQIGDRVLAQDVETGELTFKPVFETTLRPEATLLKIGIGSTEVTCSSGHPFWVSGMGWRMAKELHEGAQLHTVSGIARVEAIQPAGTGPVYNLVVADVHTYFAGESRLYTHDVTRRTSTDMILPGLRKEF